MSRRKGTKRKRYPSPKFMDQERFDYLNELKDEFMKTEITDAKHETLANLANFAYNPENYGHLFSLSVHRLFFENIGSTDEFISLCAVKGLCNLALFPPIGVYLCQRDILDKILDTLQSRCYALELTINTLLLIVTLKQLDISIDEAINIRIEQIIENKISDEVRKEKRVDNYCKILLNKGTG